MNYRQILECKYPAYKQFNRGGEDVWLKDGRITILASEVKQVLSEPTFKTFRKSGQPERERRLKTKHSPVEYAKVCRLASARTTFYIKHETRNMAGEIKLDISINTKKVKKEKIKHRPFLKWAGGKAKVFPDLNEHFPTNGKRFIEPFLGAGAVALNVEKYQNYIVNDVNADLILVWKMLQENGMDFVKECKKLFIPKNNKVEAFNALREEFNHTKNTKDNKERKAVLFVYLNRHCFNGLCRYNSGGGFNVPFGKIVDPYFPQKEFEDALDKVKQFKIYSKDFREIMEMAVEGDVVYCDPPYVPISATASFSDYAKGGFSTQDHKDLALYALDAAHRGSVVIVSNHDCPATRELYVKHKEFDDVKLKIFTLDVARTISSKVSERKSVKEVIVVFGKTRNN